MTSVSDDLVTLLNMEDAVSATCQEIERRSYCLKPKQLEDISSFYSAWNGHNCLLYTICTGEGTLLHFLKCLIILKVRL